jgi:hypothetical protein
MVGVGDEPMSRELRGGRKLVLHMGWESDGSLVNGVGTILGTLPGSGCTAYAILVETDKDQGWGDPLQEFHFRGGGDLRTDEVPPVVRRAFEEWYEKLFGYAPGSAT